MNDVDLDRIADRIAEKMAARQQSPERRLYDVPAAALYMGRSQIAIRNMAKKGVLPETKVDGKLQFDKAAMDKVISESTRWRV